LKHLESRYPRLLLLALILCLSSCASLVLKKPEVRVASIELGKSSLLQQDLKVVLRVQNPNAIALNARGLYFQLSSGDEQMASGVSDQAISIPAMGEGMVPLTVHTSMLDWLKLASDKLGNGNGVLNYRVSGYLDDVDGMGRVEFKRDGAWQLPQ
jgi:LEA14-like dessication related protein